MASMYHSGYTQNFMKEFIQLYRERPCLWQRTRDDYRNKTMTKKAYDELVQKLREVDETANRDTVKTKINSLRTAFKRTYKKTQESQKKNLQNPYKSSWCYYDCMKFLIDQNEDQTLPPPNDSSMDLVTIGQSSSTASQSNSSSNSDVIIVKTEGFSDASLQQTTNNQEDIDNIEQPSSTATRPNSPNSSNPVIVKTRGFLDASLQQTASSSNHDVDKGFGLYVVSKLNKSAENQCILAENLICEVLCRANLGTLSENTMLMEASPSNNYSYVTTNQ